MAGWPGRLVAIKTIGAGADRIEAGEVNCPLPLTGPGNQGLGDCVLNPGVFPGDFKTGLAPARKPPVMFERLPGVFHPVIEQFLKHNMEVRGFPP